jgi:glycosyltransferase involved in cell wall biosynthesis
MKGTDNDAPLLLDVTRLIWRRWDGVRATGIDRICDAWLDYFAPRAQAVIITKQRQVILPMRASQALFAALQAHRDDTRSFRRDLVKLALRWGLSLLRDFDGKERFWLNPGHTGLHIERLAEWCVRARVRPIYLVHDLIPITHPQFCRAGEDAKHRQRMTRVLQSAAGVVGNSVHTLETLAEYARITGLAMPPGIVAWPGTATLQAAAGTPEIAEMPSFVVLGTIEGRKNHALLLAVWKRMLAELGDTCPRLVIVGRRGWQADDVFATLDGFNFQGKVIEAGAVDDDRLAQLLGSARALLFPSHAEGFGIPMVEALAAGIPVIASDLEVFREIAGDIPELLPPYDEEAWIEALFDYSHANSIRRAAQLARLQVFAAPSWASHFAAIEAFLEKIDGRKGVRANMPHSAGVEII